MGSLKLQVGNQPYLLAASSYVRMNVFVLERSIKLVDEFDEHDGKNTTYAVLFDGKLPVATARLMQSKTDILSVRIGRVATLKQYRGQKCGSQVFQALEKMATKSNYKKAIVHAELTAAEFYEKLGFARCGKAYQEDETECITLTKTLD